MGLYFTVVSSRFVFVRMSVKKGKDVHKTCGTLLLFFVQLSVRHKVRTGIILLFTAFLLYKRQRYAKLTSKIHCHVKNFRFYFLFKTFMV